MTERKNLSLKNSQLFFCFSGLPGTGKSSLAKQLSKELACSYFRVDTVEQALRDLTPVQVSKEGYELVSRLANDQLQLGLTIVVDSVNPVKESRMLWKNLAKRNLVPLVNIEVFCSDQKIHRLRVEERSSEIETLKLPTWKDIQSREFHKWDEPRVQIDTAHHELKKTYDLLRDKISRFLETTEV